MRNIWRNAGAYIALVVVILIFAIKLPEFRRMFAFSKWVILESGLAWLISWGDAIALGHYLGPAALGYYRMGSVAIAFLSNIIFTPLVPVAFGLLSRLQNSPELRCPRVRLTGTTSGR